MNGISGLKLLPLKRYNKANNVNPGGWGSRPPDFGQEVWGSQRGREGSWSGRELLTSYHVQEVFSKVVTFEGK